MEKNAPHCKLSKVKALVKSGKVRATMSALSGAAALGIRFDEMLTIIASLTSKDFYKSMTSHADHRIWQDVYRPKIDARTIYLKLTVIEDVLIVSFKEL